MLYLPLVTILSVCVDTNKKVIENIQKVGEFIL